MFAARKDCFVSYICDCDRAIGPQVAIRIEYYLANCGDIFRGKLLCKEFRVRRVCVYGVDVTQCEAIVRRSCTQAVQGIGDGLGAEQGCQL